MNCLTARQTLELYRPDESDAAQHVAAVRHVDDCATCQDAVRRQEVLDLRIGQLCRDVPVPADLQDRLLARLRIGSGAAPEIPAELPATGSRIAPESASRMAAKPAGRLSRRRVLMTVLGSAALLAAGLSVWFVVGQARPSINVEEVVQSVLADGVDPAQFPEFTKFSSSLPLQLPVTMDSSWLVESPRQLPGHEAAVYVFSLRKKLQGLLIVIPRHAVKLGLPSATKFPGQPEYKPPFCTTAWVEGDFVYVCYWRGSENEFRRLERAGSPPA